MPEIFRKEIDEHSLYAVWEITESIAELESRINLRPAEKELYDTFVAEVRKKQWLAYRILVRSLLDPDDYSVEYDEVGKPYLAGSRYHISVTHSGDMAAVIISSLGLVGIDIELIKPRIERIMEKFMHPREQIQTDGPEFHGLLTLAWCAKEALYKLYGQRGLDFREDIRLDMPGSLVKESFNGQIMLERFPVKSFTLVRERLGDYLLVYVIDAPVSADTDR